MVNYIIQNLCDFYNFKDRTKKGKKNGSFKDCNQKIENKQKG